MTQRGSLEHLQIEPILNTLGTNANRTITFAQVGSSQKVLTQDTPSHESEILQKLLQELESSSVKSNRCSVHPEEDIQFYCYTNGSTLCAECLLKRNYTGLEVMNLRRAAEKLKGDLGGILSQTFNKIESTNAFQQETERYHHHTEEVIEGYREEIQRKMTAIREALAIKEKELMDRLNAIKRERVKILSGSSGSSSQKNQDEIRALKELIEYDVKGFSDLALCKFYSKKLGFFKGQQGEEAEENVQNERDMMDYFESQDQANFSKFEENLHEILTDIQTLSCEVINNRYNPISVHLESLESASMERLQQFQRNVYDNYTIKESISAQRERDNNPINIISTSRPHHQKVTSFLSSPVYGENDFMKSHTNISSKPSLITDLYRENPGRAEVKKSSYAPIIDSYREQLAKVASARTLGSSSNRNSLIDIAGILGNQEKQQQQQQQCQSAKPRITPQKFYIDAVMTSRTPRLASARPRALESSIDQVEYAMTARASSQKGILKYPNRTDSNSKKEFGLGSGLIGFDKTTFLTSPKVQSKVTTIEIPTTTNSTITSTSEKGNLRQRLSNLNAKLFN